MSELLSYREDNSKSCLLVLCDRPILNTFLLEEFCSIFNSWAMGGDILEEMGSYSTDHSSTAESFAKPNVRGETLPGSTTTLSEVAR